MSVKINIPATFSYLTNDQTVTEAEGSTLDQCLQQLVNKFPRLKTEVFGNNGRLSENIEVFVNMKSAYPEELAKEVKDGDEIHIVDVVIGG